jgi:hypothetical protein
MENVKPMHHRTRTVAFDGPDAADVLAQAARYCGQFTRPTPLRSINIEYDEPAGAASICILSITYDDASSQQP